VAISHSETCLGYTKVRDRGLKKNREWLLAAFALVNLNRRRKRLAPLGA
jgi:hypothetical protein